MSVDAKALAISFSKPLDYVEKCLKFHRITSLPRFRTPDDGLANFYSDMTAHFSTEPSRTKQEFTAECDINVIMKRFIASGFDPSTLPLTSRKAMYGDFTSLPESYHAALNYVKSTESMFLELPADLRSRFDNDPQKFIDFVEDPANEAELVALGLAVASSSSDGPRSPDSAVGTLDDSSLEGSIPSKGKSSPKAPKNAPVEHSGAD